MAGAFLLGQYFTTPRTYISGFWVPTISISWQGDKEWLVNDGMWKGREERAKWEQRHSRPLPGHSY